MSNFYVLPLAFLVGILFNFNPSCGSGTLVWTSTQAGRARLVLLASIRIGALALVGAAAGYWGMTLRKPWGILMVATAVYLLFTTIRQMRAGSAGVCGLPRESSALPWVLAVVPPPSGYIGLAIFYGGFGAPSPVQGALTLSLVGLGLTFPVWIAIFRPEWQAAWQGRLTNRPGVRRAQVIFQLGGATLLAVVGLAFIFVRNFHRPLLDLITFGSVDAIRLATLSALPHGMV